MSPRTVHNTIAQVVATYGELLVEQERLLALQTAECARLKGEVTRLAQELEASRKETMGVFDKAIDFKKQLEEMTKKCVELSTRGCA